MGWTTNPNQLGRELTDYAPTNLTNSLKQSKVGGLGASIVSLASVPEWTKGTACKAVKPRVQIPPGALYLPRKSHRALAPPRIELWCSVARYSLVALEHPLVATGTRLSVGGDHGAVGLEATQPVQRRLFRPAKRCG